MTIFHLIKYPVSYPIKPEEWAALPLNVKVEYLDWSQAATVSMIASDMPTKIRSILANCEEEL